MKKYLSVFSLFISGSFRKLMLFFTVTFAILCSLNAYLIEASGQVGFECYFNDVYTFFYVFTFVFGIGLSNASCMEPKTSYTLMRLRISEKKVLVCQSIFSFFNGLMIWAFYGLLTVITYKLYVNHFSEIEIVKQNFINDQTFFLATYRNEFLHSIFPLDDILRLVRNIVFVLAASICIPGDIYFARKKQAGFEWVILFLVMLVFFSAIWSEVKNDILPIIFCVCITVFMIGRIWYSGVLVEDPIEELPVLSEENSSEVGEYE